MIVSKIIGGLGNQMFQYAFGLSLAVRHGVELRLDTRGFANYSLHAYQLPLWKISAAALSDREAPHLAPRRPRLPRWLRRPSALRGSASGMRRIDEKPFGFRARYLETGAHAYLDGYWQSERYFTEIRQRLIEEFQPSAAISAQSRQLCDVVATTPSCFLHVRRGDYVTNPSAAKIYRHLQSDYYRAAICRLAARQAGLRVYLFSNDTEWCLNHLDVGVPIIPVSHTGAATCHEDIEIMRRCQHAVIANSTFSWWGAWLGTRAERQIYCPASWFHPGTLDDRNLNARGWLALDVDDSQRVAA